MVFSSSIFLFGFLPIVLAAYYLSPRIIKNITLLLCSLLFYAWGEIFYLGVMIISIISNYIIGLLISSCHNKPNYQSSSRLYLLLGIIINLGLLTFFKYTNFITSNVNTLAPIFSLNSIEIETIHLPLGISFFTFQALSYIVDVYRKEVSAQKNLFDLALYISLFPQLIAGPIVRYHDIDSQINHRSHSLELFASGLQRFIYGLAKKMLIANTLGKVVDSVFNFSGQELTLILAWIGILAYTLQIYFDFSGYSDMAIGLGRMFGFQFNENFNYPYIATSVREFWRRWHISLSTWFKDYVYIPLGGSRVSTLKVYRNLFVVFILTGIWHGASWNFLIWGLFHGIFLASEHYGLSKILTKASKPLQHLYLLLVIIIGWVFFRIESLPQALQYIHAMFNIFNYQTDSYYLAQIFSYEVTYAFIIGLILSTPIYRLVSNHLALITKKQSLEIKILFDTPRIILLSSLLFLSIAKITSSTYNPFIYFRF